MIENGIENDLLKDQEEGGYIEEVIAEQALATLVPCTLPLKDLLRVKPGVWTKMSWKLCFPELRVKAKPPRIPQNSKKLNEQELVSINKVSKKMGTLEGNTTLPVERENVIFMPILDSGARMSVATKSIWEKWGKPTVRST